MVAAYSSCGTTLRLVMSPLPALRVQVVLYEHGLRDIWRLLSAVAASAREAQHAARIGEVTVALGDCSRRPMLTDADVAGLGAAAADSGLHALTYDFFDANLGSAGGSNRLAAGAEEQFILVLNPDTYPAPTLLSRMVAVFEDQRVGAADARQIPLEHPKDFDQVCGDTSWVSGSCLLTRNDVFRDVGGFDTEHFFLYCDDVDFSWRVRLRGFRTVHVPGAVVFHDKRIGLDGRVVSTRLEGYHGALGRLMLASRYGRPDIVAETLESIERHGSEEQLDVLAEWRSRLERGAVPHPVDGAASVAQFIAGDYALHRF